MATLYSTRRKAESTARRGKRRYTEMATVRTRRGAARRTQLTKHSSHSTLVASVPELVAQLREIVLRLEAVYSTCVTSQLALKGQNSEQDHDIARCLRLGVSDAVSMQVKRITEIIARLDGMARESAP
jgi:hypothetical protein